jgi:hypothetical protein
LEDLGAGAAYGNLSTQGAIEGAVIDLLAVPRSVSSVTFFR